MNGDTHRNTTLNRLSKLVRSAIAPLGTALLLAAGPGFRWLGRQRVAVWFAASSCFWLWATPLASDALPASVEAQAGPRTLESVPAAEVAVVLGGAVAGAQPPMRPDHDLTSAADRVWHAARLYHAGKVRHVLLSGGASRAGQPAESLAMERFLLDLGVPAAVVWREEVSVNTATKTSESARLLRARGVGTIVLVTSALHMRRARANFERTGLVVHPAPTDFEVVDEPFELNRLLPDAGALEGSARAFKEVVGWWVGR